MTLVSGEHRDFVHRYVAREIRMLIAGAEGESLTSVAAAAGIRREALSIRANGHKPFEMFLLMRIAAHLGTSASSIVRRAEQALADLEFAEPAPPALAAPASSVPVPTPVDVLTPSRRSARAHGLPTAS